MHSKAHFKSLFKSPNISTVETKNIFFLNTTLPKEHLQFYFTIFGAFQTEDMKITKEIKNWIKMSWPSILLSLTGGTR